MEETRGAEIYCFYAIDCPGRLGIFVVTASSRTLGVCRGQTDTVLGCPSAPPRVFVMTEVTREQGKPSDTRVRSADFLRKVLTLG